MSEEHPSGAQFAIRAGSAQATVVEVGGGLRTFRVGPRDVLDGYDERAMASAGRGQLLIPWPNRVADGRYEWDGHEWQLPINEVERSTAIHGLVRFGSWDPVAQHADRVELSHVLWPSPGYPYTLELRVTYQVAETALTVTMTARNVGAEPAPYGAGQHPYLAPPSGLLVDECTLTLPAGRYLTSDDRGLPTGVETVGGTDLDFRAGRRIGGTVLDTAFTELARDTDGRATAGLEGADGRSVQLWMDERFRYLQVFTGDTLPADSRRRGLAVEPMTCPPNAFATGTDLVRLEPDEAITTTWGLTVAG